MNDPRMAWCSGCGRLQLVDRHWLALYIDADGDFVATHPERGCDIDYERPDTVFVCGQGAALAMFERYLHGHSFELLLNPNAQPGHTGQAQPATL